MNETKALQRVHPQGEAEQQQGGEDQPAATGETFGGKVGLRWDEEAAVTAFGQWPYFVEFLKTAGLFEAWGKDCPLTYSSPHAPDKREVLAPPRLGAFLDERKPDRQPKLLRGDAHGGTEQAMLGAEQRGLDYLFRLRQTTGVKRLIARLFASDDWAPAGQGWPGVRGELPLPGWSRSRKVIVWRRQVRDSLAFDESAGQQPRQLSLGRTEVVEGGILYEYAVRATSLEEKLEAIAQLYRDRGDAENNFDERKNPSGWTGSTTRDLKRSRVMAGVMALVYNGWGLFTRLTAGGKGEAITTRPLLLHGLARRTRHGRRTTLTITSSHAKARQMRTALETASGFLKRLAATAEQLGSPTRWRLILSWIFRDFLDGRVAGTDFRLADCLA